MYTRISLVSLLLTVLLARIAAAVSEQATTVPPWGDKDLEALAVHREFPLGISPEDLDALPEWPAIEWHPGVPFENDVARRAESVRVFVSRRVRPEEKPVTIEMLRDAAGIERKILAGGALGNLVEGLNVHLYVKDAAIALVGVDAPTDETRSEAVEILGDLVTRWQRILADYLESERLAGPAAAAQVRDGTPETAWLALSSIPLPDASGELSLKPIHSWRFVDWSLGSPRTEPSIIGLLSRVHSYTWQAECLSLVERLRRGGRQIPSSREQVASLLAEMKLTRADAPFIAAGYGDGWMKYLANAVPLLARRHNR